ncbi:hypothetical protein KR038_006577 [Drosophila bunnanda]|nr:hypothetical protein KR038_006577 [Drosophila bunnanda]
MSLKKKVYWGPSVPTLPECDRPNRNLRHKTFLPSYEQEEPQMCLILSWHYGRQWLEERQAHQKTIKKKTQKITKFIPPNFEKWLETRKPNITRRQRTNLPAVP